MKRIHKLTIVITKILEVFHWVGAALMTAAAVCSIAAPNWVHYFIGFDGKECCGVNLEVYGFEVNAPFIDDKIHTTGFLLFGIGAILILGIMALVFHNLHLFLKNSEGATPFRKENVRFLKKIGIFSIAVPLIGLVMSIFIRLFVGVDTAETSLDLGGIFMGLIILCLTGFFAHGVSLEEDVDGLV